MPYSSKGSGADVGTTTKQGGSSHYLLASIPKTSLLQKAMYAAIGGVALGIVIGLSFVLSQ